MTLACDTACILGGVGLYSAANEVQIVRMPSGETTITTIEQLLALPEDGLRHELLDGEHVVTPAPAPRHQLVLQELHFVFRSALADRKDLQVFLSPADVVVGPRSLVQPDLFVVTKEPGTVIGAWSEVGIPVLAVEILSPSTAARDRGKKRRIYQRAGVDEYWIVDLDARIVERWTPDDERPEILDGELSWIPAGGVGVTVDLVAVFRETLDPQR